MIPPGGLVSGAITSPLLRAPWSTLQLRQPFCLGISRFGDHIGGMRLHAIFIIAAGTMMAMSAFLVLRAHHNDRDFGSPYAGLVDIQCSNPGDNELIPVEPTCEKPSPNSTGGR